MAGLNDHEHEENDVTAAIGFANVVWYYGSEDKSKPNARSTGTRREWCNGTRTLEYGREHRRERRKAKRENDGRSGILRDRQNEP